MVRDSLAGLIFLQNPLCLCVKLPSLSFYLFKYQYRRRISYPLAFRFHYAVPVADADQCQIEGSQKIPVYHFVLRESNVPVIIVSQKQVWMPCLNIVHIQNG